ncbi:hypothetical protein Tco_1438093 [Tanacetum coccineum]
MGRDTVQLETVISTISQEYLLEFTSEYGISEGLHPDFPGRGDRIVDFPEGKVEMDLFNLISTQNPAIVKTGTRQRAAHEVPLLTATASQVIDIEDVVATSTSSSTPSAIEVNLEREVTAMGPLVNKRHRKRDQRKSLVAMGLGVDSTIPTPIPQETPADVIGPDLLFYARPSSKGTAAAEDPESEKSTSFTSLAGSPGGIYQSGWGVTNNCRLDTPEACQDMMDHSVPPGYFFELRHLPNPEFLSQYNMTLAWQVAMRSQLRLRFEQEVRLRREATAKIARRNQRIQAREEEIKKLDEEVQSLRVVETEAHGLRNRTQNLETLLEAKVDMKKAVDAKNAELVKELEILRTQQAFAKVVSAGIAKGFCDGLKYGVELGEVKLDLANIEAYDPEAKGKFTATMQALKDLKYPLIDEMEKLKDAPIDIIMASLYLESDTGEDAL